MKLQRFLALVCLSSQLVCASAYAADEPRQQLDSVKQQIKQLSADIAKRTLVFDETSQKIKQFDSRVSKYSQQVKQLEQSRDALQAKITNLQSDSKALELQTEQYKKQLANLTRALYAIGKQNYLKMFFSQDDPTRHLRNQEYYRAISQRIHEKTLSLQENEQRLLTLQQSLKEKQENYKKEILNLEEQKQLLVKERKEKTDFLQQIANTISSIEKRKSNLLEQEKQLEALIRELAEIERRKLASQESGIAFAKSKKDLSWPVSGKVIQQYGRPRKGSGLKSRGVLIATQNGADVHAVEKGTIIFSDWLTGYGYVMIVDHGKSYMSLYGHNQRLLKSVGDQVNKNEIIAEAGNSGRQGDAVLYFEIRHRGKPVNPTQWIAARKTR